VAAAVEKEFPSVEVLGNAKGSPRSSAFEVTGADGTVYWSKLSGKGFPSPSDLIAKLKEAGISSS